MNWSDALEIRPSLKKKPTLFISALASSVPSMKALTGLTAHLTVSPWGKVKEGILNNRYVALFFGRYL